MPAAAAAARAAGVPRPIILPPKPGENGPGVGYTLDEVRQLNEFLPNEWSGGGRPHHPR